MSCALCGLDAAAARFCCAGCENVYAILEESGVLASGQDFRDTELYRESLRLGLISNPAVALPSVPEGAEMREAVFRVSGMWCTSCAWLIEHALTRIGGIAAAEVHFSSDLLKVRYCPQYVPPERIRERVASLGYRASEDTGDTRAAEAERKDLLLRTGIAAFLWLNVMAFSLVVYTSYFQNVGQTFGRYIPLLLMALATPSVFYCAAPILRVAWAGTRNRALGMESLLALGILSAYGYSAAVALRGGTHVYFDTACAVVALVLTGKTIERAAKQKTARALTLLYRLMPNKARLISDGRERFVSTEAIRVGTIFRVKPGERIAADGIVVEGRSHVDESVLTGESAPRAKEPGDAVISGSINTGDALDIRATRVGQDSTLAQIVHRVEQASARRTSVERLADRIARVFIPVVLALAVATFAGWMLRGPAAEALLHAIAVLVIACPCALGIATPLALTAAVSAASRHGILVADTRVLETIGEVNALVLDKTGTVTEGRFTLLQTLGDGSRMAHLAAIEAYSPHPIAKAMGGAGALAASGVIHHPGMGISGVVNGTRYFVGNRRMAVEWSAREPEWPGCTCYFGWDGAVRGGLVFGDPVRPEAAQLCAALGQKGIRTIVVSGDAAGPTEAAAKAIGADEWRGEASPDGKVEFVRGLQAQGLKVAMVGDGVNDAPSLAQADLGIALGSGADLAMHAAPLVLMGNSLAGVTLVFDLARRTFRVVRQNLFWAFAYNGAGITLAMTGVLTPIAAAAAMVLSSLSVIGNSRRLSGY